MNIKGQLGVGTIIVTAIALIAGVIFFQSIAQQVGSSTSTVAVANETLDSVVNGTSQYLTNYRALSDVVILNATDPSGFTPNATVIGSGNYTVTNNVIDPTTGGLSVQITPDATAGWTSAWQVSGTGQKPDYIADAGGRSMASLIVIFFALALVAAALYPVLKDRWWQ